MTANVASPRRSVNGISSRRRRDRPPEDTAFAVEDILPVVGKGEEEFDERWTMDQVEEPRIPAAERFRLKALKLKEESERTERLGLADDDEDEEETDEDDYSEEEAAQVAAAMARVERLRRGETARGNGRPTNGRIGTGSHDAQLHQQSTQPQERHTSGTPSLRKRAEKEGFVLVYAVFRQICDNGDQALLLAQLTYWFDRNRDGRQRANFKRHGRIWEPKTHAGWAKETGIPEQRIRRVIDGLVKLGFVERSHAKYRGGRTTILRPLPGKIARACGYECKTRPQKR